MISRRLNDALEDQAKILNMFIVHLNSVLYDNAINLHDSMISNVIQANKNVMDALQHETIEEFKTKS